MSSNIDKFCNGFGLSSQRPNLGLVHAPFPGLWYQPGPGRARVYGVVGRALQTHPANLAALSARRWEEMMVVTVKEMEEGDVGF